MIGTFEKRAPGTNKQGSSNWNCKVNVKRTLKSIVGGQNLKMRRLYRPIVSLKEQSEFFSAGFEQKKISKNMKKI